MIRFARFPSPLGTLLAVAEGDLLTGVYFEGQRYAPSVSADWKEDRDGQPFDQCARQLADYFAGRRRDFDLPLTDCGTPFQRRVWREIARIGYGRTLTYAELASRAGSPGSARAAGAATGRNPFTLVIPCHRVVASDGALAGYAGGVARKAKLIAMERTFA